ncbi:MFS general substrate transporter [Crassisporium funariophilum]|nr:MFS general substrate transporter [Crassisporium funariophilum]
MMNTVTAVTNAMKSSMWSRQNTKPMGLIWRSSSWTVTFVIGLGIAVDLLVYSIIIPVMPFHLERLGYSNVSALTGWLLFAYSAGLVISTIPIAMLSERYNARQLPLVFGLLILLASQALLMEAPNYPVMCIARILQGIGSSMVWVVGLALLCDSAPPSMVGLQLGIAMCGLSVGLVIGPPVGGVLYSRFGYRGPFVFGMAATLLDLIGRLLIIERKDAISWGVDPAASRSGLVEQSNQASTINDVEPPASSEVDRLSTNGLESDKHNEANTSVEIPLATANKNLSLLTVIMKLMKSSRALVALIIIFVYGVVYSSQEPAIPLHLQRVWNLNPESVGLVFIAAVIPTLFSSPLTGYFADKKGAEWSTFLCLLLALPWWVIVIIQRQLSLFIVAFAIESFFTSGVIAPLTAELAAVSRDIDGVGYGHVYGAFNLVYGIGTSVGPIVGGQMYDRLNRGWMALCLLATGLLAVSLLLAVGFVGSDPLLRRLMTRFRARSNDGQLNC